MISGKSGFVALVVALAAAFCLAGLAGAKEQEIFLPDDVDAVTINGQGFQLRFEEIKKDFAQVQREAAKVEVPRPQPSDSDSDSSAGANEAEEQERGVSNEDLFDKTAREAGGEKDYGYVDDALFEWIGARATSLMQKVERYNGEAAQARDTAKIVVDIMLLNTLVDLDNLNKEEIAKFKWVKAKLRKLLTEHVHEQANAGEVLEYTRKLIDQNKVLEIKVRGSNDPGKAWMTNTQALRRVLHEQRYSDALSKIIIEYLSGPFNMMKRSAVFQINRRSKVLDDGMYYVFAPNKVPANFPFSAQDAISRGDN